MSKPRHEFKLVIEGIELPREILQRINETIQKAALAELASSDLRGKDLVFSPIMSRMVDEQGDGGSTGGAQVRIMKTA